MIECERDRKGERERHLDMRETNNDKTYRLTTKNIFINKPGSVEMVTGCPPS